MKNELVKQTTKVNKLKYDVEVMIWEDGYYHCISYDPIPSVEVRQEIDTNIGKWVGYKLKSKPL